MKERETNRNHIVMVFAIVAVSEHREVQDGSVLCLPQTGAFSFKLQNNKMHEIPPTEWSFSTLFLFFSLFFGTFLLLNDSGNFIRLKQVNFHY